MYMNPDRAEKLVRKLERSTSARDRELAIILRDALDSPKERGKVAVFLTKQEEARLKI